MHLSTVEARLSQKDYATIMNTIQTRGYAERGESEGSPREIIVLSLTDDQVDREVVEEKTGSNRGKLIPTPAGELISGFLREHFEPVIDYGFTARVEKDFDEIASDTLPRNEMLDNFYSRFHSLIEK